MITAAQEDRIVAEEPVYAPDQLKPGNRKWGRRGALGSAAIMLLYFWGNHEGNTENLYLAITALALVGLVIADVVLRRNGLKPNDQ
ncbi:hypothetical protein AB0M54_32795 [Actinoplanes sp. NPDC051470]|uniref:hypothetical protein n=1 Tax=unclassified Actinoplanes TaxID=2626549 RepID=UPI00342FCFEE